MPNLKAKLLKGQEPDKLRETLYDLRAELSKLRSTAARRPQGGALQASEHSGSRAQQEGHWEDKEGTERHR